jgi:transposase
VADEIEQAAPPVAGRQDKQVPKRAPLPSQPAAARDPPRARVTTCACGCQMKRIGEDVAEKLDYAPGVFTVERHIRGKWACAQCETIHQAPVDPHIIDKGIPTTGLAGAGAGGQVRRPPAAVPPGAAIFGRAGLAIPARRWRSGWARVACSCSRWLTP